MTHMLYVVGGEQRHGDVLKHNTDQPPYQKAIITEVDLHAQRTRRVVEYMSPPEVCAWSKTPDIVFKSGTLQDKRFYVCTPTEVLIYSFPEFEKVGYITLPCFNDLHHVCPTDQGTLLVVVTGLDLVIEMTERGAVLREWNVLGEPPWQRFAKSIDYRKVLSTKPHQSHPNHAFQLENAPWVTRFAQRDAICLTDPTLCIHIGIEKPHDGISYNNHIYFTTVDGHVVIADKVMKRIEIFDLNTISKKTDRVLGWCRGMKVVNDHTVIVGFTSLRETQYQENIRWVKEARGTAESPQEMPTRIAQYDLKSEKLLWEFNLEHASMNRIFSIH